MYSLRTTYPGWYTVIIQRNTDKSLADRGNDRAHTETVTLLKQKLFNHHGEMHLFNNNAKR